MGGFKCALALIRMAVAQAEGHRYLELRDWTPIALGRCIKLDDYFRMLRDRREFGYRSLRDEEELLFRVCTRPRVDGGLGLTGAGTPSSSGLPPASTTRQRKSSRDSTARRGARAAGSPRGGQRTMRSRPERQQTHGYDSYDAYLEAHPEHPHNYF